MTHLTLLSLHPNPQRNQIWSRFYIPGVLKSISFASSVSSVVTITSACSLLLVFFPSYSPDCIPSDASKKHPCLVTSPLKVFLFL